jgi:hypothetical protein
MKKIKKGNRLFFLNHSICFDSRRTNFIFNPHVKMYSIEIIIYELFELLGITL